MSSKAYFQHCRLFITTDAIIQIPQDVKEDIDHVLPTTKTKTIRMNKSFVWK